MPSAAPKLLADDAEIERYAALLDHLGIGLIVYGADASIVSRNPLAALLGDTPPGWLDEQGQPLPASEQPAWQALRSGQPVATRLVGVDRGAAQTSWFKADAVPVLAADGSIRRVLLTLQDVSRERQLASELEKLSVTDPLTGLSTEAHIVQLLENEIHRARRYGTPFALAQIDIDQFLPFCQTHGQPAGDRVLAEFGQLLRRSIREIDMAGRNGIDEFLLILPNVSLNDAMVGLERIRVLIETHDFSDTRLKVTISGGITEYTGENAATLIERSRSLLLHARESGRNRLCLDLEIF
jgi:diguanylate cyclase (GGDEF)-like protein